MLCRFDCDTFFKHIFLYLIINRSQYLMANEKTLPGRYVWPELLSVFEDCVPFPIVCLTGCLV